MAYLLFSEAGKGVGDADVAIQCTSAIFNYQVIGAGATVEFSGSNHPAADVANDAHWQPIVSISSDTPDTEPYRQHAWDKVRYKVVAGTNVEIYVSSGVSG